MSDTASAVRRGRYQHYKGMPYEVLGVAKDSEVLEEFVVYRALYGAHDLWIRPKTMFLEVVVDQGRKVPRFTFIDCPENDDELPYLATNNS